jgi:hypothetical protein
MCSVSMHQATTFRGIDHSPHLPAFSHVLRPHKPRNMVEQYFRRAKAFTENRKLEKSLLFCVLQSPVFFAAQHNDHCCCRPNELRKKLEATQSIQIHNPKQLSILSVPNLIYLIAGFRFSVTGCSLVIRQIAVLRSIIGDFW